MQPENQSISALLAELRTKVENKRLKQVINALSRIDTSQVERKDFALFAEIARKAGVPIVGARIFKGEKTNSRDLLAYASCLAELGAVHEAIQILSENRSDWPSERRTLLAQLYIQIWEVRAALTLLEKPINEAETESLLFCYRFLGEFENVRALLKKGGVSVRMRALSELVLEGFSQSNRAGAISRMNLIRETFEREGIYHAVREIDFYLGLLRNDKELISKLYFGTPSQAFRERLRQAFPGEMVIPAEFDIGIKGEETRVFDLFAGKEDGSKEVRLKVGQVLHRLLVCLLSDQYEPIKVAGVHEAVFKGEAFDPMTSPGRVHQIIKRLKKWLIEQKLPVLLDEREGQYQLRMTGPYLFRLSGTYLPIEKREPLYLRLELHLPRTDFSIQEAAKSLGLSRRFARKILERAEKQGWVLMKGRGRSTRYEFHRQA